MASAVSPRPRYRIEPSSFSSDESSAASSPRIEAISPDDLACRSQQRATRTQEQQHRFLLDAQRPTSVMPALAKSLESPARRSRSLDPQKSSTCEQRVKRLATKSAVRVSSTGLSSLPDARTWSADTMGTLESNDKLTYSRSSADLTAAVRPVSLLVTGQDSYSPMAAAFLRHSSEQPRPPRLRNEELGASLLFR